MQVLFSEFIYKKILMEANRQISQTEIVSNSAATRQLKWSARMKSSGVQIKGRAIIRTAPIERNRYGFLGIGGLTNCISKEVKKCQLIVHIKALRNWMDIGICQIKYAQSHQFV